MTLGLRGSRGGQVRPLRVAVTIVDRQKSPPAAMSRRRLPWTTLATVGVQARGNDGDRGREPACGAARGRLRRPPPAVGPWRPLPCGRPRSQAPPQPALCHPLPCPAAALDDAAHFFRAAARPACEWRPCPSPAAFLRLLRGRRAGDRPLPPRPLPPAASPEPRSSGRVPAPARRRLGPPPSPADGGVRGGAWDAPHRLHGLGDRQRRAQGVRGGAWDAQHRHRGRIGPGRQGRRLRRRLGRPASPPPRPRRGGIRPRSAARAQIFIY